MQSPTKAMSTDAATSTGNIASLMHESAPPTRMTSHDAKASASDAATTISLNAHLGLGCPVAADQKIVKGLIAGLVVFFLLALVSCMVSISLFKRLQKVEDKKFYPEPLRRGLGYVLEISKKV
jgi:hypothetical protein